MYLLSIFVLVQTFDLKRFVRRVMYENYKDFYRTLVFEGSDKNTFRHQTEFGKDIS